MKTNQTSKATLVLDYGKRTVKADKICYIESKFGNYSNIVINRAEHYLTSFTIKRYCQELMDLDYFVQGSKGLLLNLLHLDKIILMDGALYAQMTNGTKLKLSRRKGKELKEKLIEASL